MPTTRISVPLAPEKPPKGPPRLKRWTFAGLLLTYWCNAQCAFCYVYSGPNKKSGPKLSVPQALAFWRGLNRLVDEGGPSYGPPGERLCRIHFAGGEPFYDFDRLLAIAQAAQAANLRVFEKVETNAFWATDDAVTRDKIQKLADAGMQLLLISADVYHQEFVPVERCARAARIARDILGEKGVRVRWWDFIDQPIDILAMNPDDRRRAFADALVRHRERILGRAADQLADYYECHPPDHFAAESCREPTLGSKHVHIDAYGNVFPGVCSGIVWGRIDPDAPPAPAAPPPNPPPPWPAAFPSIEHLWRHAADHWPTHPIIARVVAGGSYRLFEYARDRGFTPRPAGYANKCHLCHDVRRWLFEHHEFGPCLGPAEVYHETPERDSRRTALALPVLPSPPPPAPLPTH